MGAVHGCHMKYVALSLLSLLAIPLTTSASLSSPPHPLFPYPLTPLTILLLYSAILNFAISIMFKLRFGCTMLLKDPTSGSIPLLSYLIWSPFHIPTILYTFIHTEMGVRHGVGYADEVMDGLWVGGRYAHKIDKKQNPPSSWSVTVDLTSEFPELSISSTDLYINSPVWDGTPPSISEIDRCAQAISSGWRGSKFRKDADGVGFQGVGDVMVHCAHGRGRSCLIACAGIVKSGRADTWEEGFEIVKKGRSVCKLNKGMRKALEEWQKKYMV